MKTIAIIQARMGSTRLPGKVLTDICGKPLIQRVIERVAAARGLDAVIVATTTDHADDILVAWCLKHSVPVFRGSEEDVLDRYWQCARQYGAEVIVRVTADDPLKDPTIIDRALQIFKGSSNIDYVSNTLEPSYPEGLDIEVVRYRALDRAAQEASLASEREHVLPFIWKRPERFALRGFNMLPNLSHWRWTVDKPADLEFARAVFTKFQDQPLIHYTSVVSWLIENPQIMSINAGTARNEGYGLSLLKEKKNEQPD